MKKNIDVLQHWLTEEAIDACLITNPENVAYFSGYVSEPHERVLALAVFQEAEPFLFVPGLEIEDVKGGDWSHPVYGYSDIENPWEIITSQLKNRASLSNLAVEKGHMTVERYEILQSLLPDSAFANAEEKIQMIRLIKTPEELQILKEAALLADYAVEVGVSEIAEGKTEAEIVAKIEFEMKKKGVTAMSFDTMVLTGKNGALPHGTPGDTKIQKGDLVLFDLGVVHKGYCSDITRTVAFGDISAEQEKIYQTVLEAQEAAVAAVQAGKTAKDIDLTARNIIAEAGYGDYFPHRLGHGLGASVHEFPSITETNEMPLQTNMVFTIEPGIYVPEVAGVRIEDDIVVTENGCTVLTEYPKGLQVIR